MNAATSRNVKGTSSGKEGILESQFSEMKMQIAKEGMKRPSWRVFLSTTSAHGYPHIVDNKYPMIVRMCWVLLW